MTWVYINSILPKFFPLTGFHTYVLYTRFSTISQQFLNNVIGEYKVDLTELTP
jgi:hypothetical protein